MLVDDGTGVISCKCFKRTSILQEEAISKLKDELNGGPIEHKLNTILTEIEQGFNGFNIGELLHVRGTLQTYKNVREIKAYHCAVMHCLSAETERMLHLPLLYQSVYDKPFVLPDRLAREISSLPNGELDQRKLSHELRLQDEFMKLIVSHLDEKKLDKTSEHDLYESVKCSTEKVVNEPLLWKKALSSLEATGHLCRQSSKKGEYLVIKYNKQLNRSVIEIILKHAEHQKGNSDPGCHFMHIYDELRKLLPFSQLNKPSLWKCLGLLEEQSDIISSTEKHFIVFS